LFWLAVLALGAVSLGCVALGLSIPPADAEGGNCLRADPVIPKLNNVDTDGPAPRPGPARAEPVPSEPASVDRKTTELPRVVELEPPQAAVAVHAPPPGQLPAVPMANSEPLVSLPRREPTFGESPMTRTWNTLALAALLAAPAAPVATAQGTPAADPDTKVLLQRLDELRKSVDALVKKFEVPAAKSGGEEVLTELNRLEKAILGKIDKLNHELKTDMSAIKEEQLKRKMELQNLSGLRKKIESIEGEVSTLYTELQRMRKQLLSETPLPPAIPGPDKVGMDELRNRLAAIEKSLADLKPLTTSSNRISASPPLAAGLARVQLVNLFSEPLLFMVNGRPYRVDAGETLPIDGVPAGTIQYEVFADRFGLIRPLRTTTIEPNKTLTLTAR
jgi:hypothetical protein